MGRIDDGSEVLVDNGMMALGYQNYKVFEEIAAGVRNVKVPDGIDLDSATLNQVNQVSELVRSIASQYGIELDEAGIRKVSYGAIASYNLAV